MTPRLELAGAQVRREGALILDGADLSVDAGEVVGLVGPNGAGKTTLIRAALGVWRLSAGAARLGGEDVRHLSASGRARRAAYLPQERRLAWGVAAWRAASLGAPHLPPAQARAAALAALERVGIAHLADRSVFAMSGGERARVLLARLLVTGAPLLVADEPAAGLDPEAQFATLAILRAEAKRGAAVLVTLHDLTLAARCCDRVAVLKAGRVVANAPPAYALGPAVLSDVFGLRGDLMQTPAGLVLAACAR